MTTVSPKTYQKAPPSSSSNWTRSRAKPTAPGDCEATSDFPCGRPGEHPVEGEERGAPPLLGAEEPDALFGDLVGLDDQCLESGPRSDREGRRVLGLERREFLDRPADTGDFPEVSLREEVVDRRQHPGTAAAVGPRLQPGVEGHVPAIELEDLLGELLELAVQARLPVLGLQELLVELRGRLAGP